MGIRAIVSSLDKKYVAAVELTFVLAAMASAQAQVDPQARITESVLRNFAVPSHGAFIYGGVVRDAAGNLYGTASSGGSADSGLIYEVSAAGRQTILLAFTGGLDGGLPLSGLVRDSSGNLYGTTYVGGSAGLGVVFELDTKGNETVLHNFTCCTDGILPNAGVALDASGNVYGTTPSGGSLGHGVVYKLDSTGNETILHNFTNGADGGSPNGGVVLDSAGNLYGTTTLGGTHSAGAVFKIDTSGNETVLHNFTGGSDGGQPYAGVVLDAAGNLYGATQAGGSAELGVVFKLDTSGNETVLHNFTGGSDGANALGGVTLDSAGNLYGATKAGGSAGLGVVYKVNASASETILHTFTGGSDGATPWAGVTLDSSGNLYGTTYAGGTGAVGVVFKVTATGAETVRYTFPGSTGGWTPYSGVTRNSSGDLYGTTDAGGSGGAGVVYELNGIGLETVLYNFTGGADGGYPQAGVVFDSPGNLYGTASGGGSAGGGVVFKLDTAGAETVLHNFTYGPDGAQPQAGVVLDSSGNLYGTTVLGGSFGAGAIYKLDSSGDETVLYSFTGLTAGGSPYSGVIRDSGGSLYGTASRGGSAGAGVVYKLDPSGNETVLHNFAGPDGSQPYAGVVMDSAGNLYGTTYNGGLSGAGVVYKIDTSGSETVLYSFTGGPDGGFPYAGVILDSSGNLYGTTSRGGSAGAGAVYEISAGVETVLHNFTGGEPDGSAPYAGLTLDSLGNLYGTTLNAGKDAGGVVFKIKGAAGRQ